MKFTQDWFSSNIPGIKLCIDMLENKSKFLEIGCFEGMSTCWLLEQMDGGLMYSIDNFAGDGEFDLSGDDLFEIAIANIQETVKDNQCHQLMRTLSYDGLAELIKKEEMFDFIYIDGSHDPRDVLVDICMSWGMLKNGGIMMLDDAAQEKVREAINSFYRLFHQDCEVVFNEYQMGIKKK